jgi:plasmid stabilization system protein ParE
MSRNVILRPGALRDIAQAKHWYEERRTGLGADFVQSVEACIESIRRNPEWYAMAHESYRRALVRRFPYAVFYEYAADTITVYAVFHCSQDPEKLRSRFP